MKALALVMLLLGCASSNTVLSDEFPTIRTSNLSGFPVQILMRTESASIRLGRAWPGEDCFSLAAARVGANVYFGLTHSGRPTVWAPGPIRLFSDEGLSLRIGQPEQARFDIQRITYAEKC